MSRMEISIIESRTGWVDDAEVERRPVEEHPHENSGWSSIIVSRNSEKITREGLGPKVTFLLS